MVYDDRSGTAYSYTYDEAGRMTSLSVNGTLTAQYLYNAAGQQVVRRLPSETLEIRSIFGPSGNRIAEYEISALTGALVGLREYVWLDDQPVAVVENGAVYYIRTDHIGRPELATDDLGAVVWSVEYLPFGGVHASTGGSIDLRFPGQWFQTENGLHQNWMRDCDPTTGRYLQADLVGLIDGASIYGYATNYLIDTKGARSDLLFSARWTKCVRIEDTLVVPGTKPLQLDKRFWNTWSE